MTSESHTLEYTVLEWNAKVKKGSHIAAGDELTMDYGGVEALRAHGIDQYLTYKHTHIHIHSQTQTHTHTHTHTHENTPLHVHVPIHRAEEKASEDAIADTTVLIEDGQWVAVHHTEPVAPKDSDSDDSEDEDYAPEVN